ncbi:MAG: hypothetical protein ACLGIY_22230, partial [Betaproteobacteria bacterium]
MFGLSRQKTRRRPRRLCNGLPGSTKAFYTITSVFGYTIFAAAAAAARRALARPGSTCGTAPT